MFSVINKGNSLKYCGNHGRRSRGQLETAIPGSSLWMLYTPQGVKGFDDLMIVEM